MLRFHVLAMNLLSMVAVGATSPPPTGPVKSGHCLAVSKSILRQQALAVQWEVASPKKVHHVEPRFPTREDVPTGRVKWLGEALIDTTGKVRQVWVVQEPEFERPWPEFSDAILAAVRQWEYEPATLNGRSVPVCMTITVNMKWR